MWGDACWPHPRSPRTAAPGTRVRRNKYCILYLSLRKFGKWIFYLFSVWKEAALTHAPHCFTSSLDDDVNRLMQRCRHCSDAENCKDILPTFYTGLSLSWLFYYCIASLHCFTRQVVSPGYVGHVVLSKVCCVSICNCGCKDAIKTPWQVRVAPSVVSWWGFQDWRCIRGAPLL